MFVIVTYDVNSKKVSKVLKLCRKYLIHVQKSVFEGAITEGKLNRLKRELLQLIDVERDSVCIYRLDSSKYAKKEEIGVVMDKSHII